MLYVGGRPSTRLFRFSGSISNLFVSTAALSLDNIITLHDQALEGGQINIINATSDSSVRYCFQYRSEFEQCYVNSFEDNDFRWVCNIIHCTCNTSWHAVIWWICINDQWLTAPERKPCIPWPPAHVFQVPASSSVCAVLQQCCHSPSPNNWVNCPYQNPGTMYQSLPTRVWVQSTGPQMWHRRSYLFQHMLQELCQRSSKYYIYTEVSQISWNRNYCIVLNLHVSYFNRLWNISTKTFDTWHSFHALTARVLMNNIPGLSCRIRKEISPCKEIPSE